VEFWFCVYGWLCFLFALRLRGASRRARSTCGVDFFSPLMCVFVLSDAMAVQSASSNGPVSAGAHSGHIRGTFGAHSCFSLYLSGSPVVLAGSLVILAGSLEECVFEECVFEDCVFEECVFAKWVFSKGVFSQSVFSKGVFSQSVFSKSVFSQSVFSKSVFSKSVCFRKAVLASSAFGQTQFPLGKTQFPLGKTRIYAPAPPQICVFFTPLQEGRGERFRNIIIIPHTIKKGESGEMVYSIKSLNGCNVQCVCSSVLARSLSVPACPVRRLSTLDRRLNGRGRPKFACFSRHYRKDVAKCSGI